MKLSLVFFVTMLGVWAALYLAGWAGQKALDKTTEQRLHLTVLESQYNGSEATKIVDDYTDTAILNLHFNRLDSSSATAAFQDANILSFLPYYKVSLLRSYVEAIDTLNRTIELHCDVLGKSGYKQTSTENDIRKKVRDNAASVVAMAFILQEELKQYFDENQYDDVSIKKIEERVKVIKAKALKGEVSLSKKE